MGCLLELVFGLLGDFVLAVLWAALGERAKEADRRGLLSWICASLGLAIMVVVAVFTMYLPAARQGRLLVAPGGAGLAGLSAGALILLTSLAAVYSQSRRGKTESTEDPHLR